LDLNLPDMSGFEVLRSLRVSKVKTPILILTGLGGIEDKVRGLGFGADDYMTKPFHKDELVARIHAIVRRSKGHAQSVIQTGDLLVNLDTKTVEVSGERVHLTGKEYQMLELLSLRKGTTLTKVGWAKSRKRHCARRGCRARFCPPYASASCWNLASTISWSNGFIICVSAPACRARATWATSLSVVQNTTFGSRPSGRRRNKR